MNRRFAKLSLEPLEARNLLAGDLIVHDYLTGGDPAYGFAAAAGELVYYRDVDDNQSEGLYELNLDTLNTTRLADANDHLGSLGFAKPIGMYVLFAHNDAEHGPELRVYDSTTGDVQTIDIYPGQTRGYMGSSYVLGDHIYITGLHPDTGIDLFRWDLATSELDRFDLAPGRFDSRPRTFASLGTDLYFIADDRNLGSELYRFDTLTDSYEVIDINVGVDSSRPHHMEIIAGKIYLTAFVEGVGMELVRFDPSTDSLEVFDVAEGAVSSWPRDFTKVGDHVYFVSRTPLFEVVVHRIGVNNDQIETFEFDWEPAHSGPAGLTAFGNDLYFYSNVNGSVHRIAESGQITTFEVSATRILPNGTDLYLITDDSEAGRELARLDAATDTFIVYDFAPGVEGSIYSSQLVFHDNDIFMTTRDTAHGYELRRFDRVTETLELVADLNEGPNDSYAGRFGGMLLVGDRLIFSADDLENRYQLHVLDVESFELESLPLGVEHPVEFPDDPFPYAQPFLPAGDDIFFVRYAHEFPNGMQLDGVTHQVSLFNSAYDFRIIGSYGDRLFTWTSNFFPGLNEEYDYWISELNTTTGESTFFQRGTASLVDATLLENRLIYSVGIDVVVRNLDTNEEEMYPTTALGAFRDFTLVGGDRLFFNATASSGRNLHMLNLLTGEVIELGTPASNLIAADDYLFATHQQEVLRVDREGQLTRFGFLASQLTTVGNDLFFTSSDNEHGHELWKIEGDSGQSQLIDILPGAQSSDPDSLTAVDDRLFFAANDEFLGRELHSVDATTGALATYDITLGLLGSDASDLTHIGGDLIFGASDPLHGFEMRRLDLASDQISVYDLVPGPAGSHAGLVNGFAATDRRLYFMAEMPAFGYEIVSVGIDFVGQSGCDLTADGVCDLSDIDQLMEGLATGAYDRQFDLNGDSLLNLMDRDRWLKMAGERRLGPGRAFLPGDANLDGEVDVSDFGLWNSNKFTFETRWSRGNFNGDLVVDVSDWSEWNSSKFSAAGEIWTLRNREYNDRYIFEADNGNAELALSADSSSQWFMHATPLGLTLQNRSSGDFLVAYDWEAFTVSADDQDIPRLARYWETVDNGDGSVALRNRATLRFLDADGAGADWDVDESADIGNDDGWFIASSAAERRPTSSPLAVPFGNFDEAEKDESHFWRYRRKLKFLP